ncbi:orotidine-5'-phosphate decarboxylase [Flavobacteriales bacterium]|nr:orotidine-5'-phosphate decarboxylase [Flavobacteriales bacterium]
MTRLEIYQQIVQKKSFLCVGLDTDINNIPSFLLKEEDPVFEFNRRIIDATKDLCVAYKPNIAFYEAEGPKGWESLQKTLDYIPNDIFTIADAKRGDIGNTSKLYSRAFFEKLHFDSVTVAPYMGSDSVTPFLHENKTVIVLGLTSNTGSQDFQYLKLASGKRLFEEVIEKTKSWGTLDQIMFVVGATQSSELKKIREIVPNHFLLVPGVGAQGGDLVSVAKNGFNKQCGLLVNSSRGIIYADSSSNFDVVAKQKATEIQLEMEKLLNQYSI